MWLGFDVRNCGFGLSYLGRLVSVQYLVCLGCGPGAVWGFEPPHVVAKIRSPPISDF